MAESTMTLGAIDRMQQVLEKLALHQEPIKALNAVVLAARRGQRIQGLFNEQLEAKAFWFALEPLRSKLAMRGLWFPPSMLWGTCSVSEQLLAVPVQQAADDSDEATSPSRESTSSSSAGSPPARTALHAGPDSDNYTYEYKYMQITLGTVQLVKVVLYVCS